MYTIIWLFTPENVSLYAAVVFLDILPSVRFGDHRRVAHTAAVPGQEFGGKICKFSEDLHVPLEVIILRHDPAEFIRSVVDLIVAGTLGIRKLQLLNSLVLFLERDMRWLVNTSNACV